MSTTDTDQNHVANLPAHLCIREPDLLFDPIDDSQTAPHPLAGLQRFGPYSASLKGQVGDPIRLALIGPEETRQKINGLIEELNGWHNPTERTRYLIDYYGFKQTFGVGLSVASSNPVRLADSLDRLLEESGKPQQLLSEHLARAVNAVQAERSSFDVLIIFLPTRWEPYLEMSSVDAINIHDFVKSHTASAGIPCQIIRESRTMQYSDRCSVAWRLGIALYAKAGGIPWKLAHTQPDTMHVGLGYALKHDIDGSPTFLTTCSQVFDHDGGGFEFIAYETDDITVELDNPFLSRGEMQRVMARSLSLYQHRTPVSRVVLFRHAALRRRVSRIARHPNGAIRRAIASAHTFHPR